MRFQQRSTSTVPRAIFYVVGIDRFLSGVKHLDDSARRHFTDPRSWNFEVDSVKAIIMISQ